MSDKLRVLFDTTVFCGALVKPDGGNMRCLLLANAPFFDPIVSQGVLAGVDRFRGAGIWGIGRCVGGMWSQVRRCLPPIRTLAKESLALGEGRRIDGEGYPLVPYDMGIVTFDAPPTIPINQTLAIAVQDQRGMAEQAARLLVQQMVRHEDLPCSPLSYRPTSLSTRGFPRPGVLSEKN